MGWVERFLTFGGRRKALSAVLVALLCALAVGGALRLEIDTSYDSLVSPEDAGWPDYRAVTETFGSDNTTIILVSDPELWDPDKLYLLEEAAFALEDLEATESVDSLFSALNIRDADGWLETAPLMDYAPVDAEAAAEIRDDALYSPVLRGNLISEDGRTTAINVTVSRDRRNPEFNAALYAQVEEVIAPLRAEFDQVVQIGPPRLNVEIERGMFADLSILSPISTLILIGSIIFFLRTPAAAGVPIATSLVSILWTFGFMGYVGVPLSLLTAIVPSLIIVIGSTEDTHLLTAYLRGLSHEKDPTRARAVRYMAKHVGLPIFVTGFTTAVGFFSNAVSDIPLIRDFAYAASFAMLANLVATILIVPLLLTLAGPRTNKIETDPTDEDARPARGLIPAIQSGLETIGARHGRTVLAATGALMILFAWTATDVRVSNDPLSYFKDDHPLVADAALLHERLSGMQIFYVSIDAGEEGAFREAETLKRVEAMAERLRETEAFDKVIAITDYLALVNREMHGGDPSYHRTPETESETAEYLLLFQRGDIARYVGPEYRRANIVVRHNLSDSHDLNAVLASVRPDLEALTPDGATLVVTGENLLINRAAEGLFQGQIESLAILIVIIVLVMTALYTSLLAGLVSLIPNLIPILFNFGVMGLFGIPLNPGTATVAAIAVGIAIDDTIHLMTHYAEESRRTEDPAEAMRRTLRGQAAPVISTSLSLALGFGVLVFSEFNIVAQFGVLAALTMIYALLSDLLVSPLILRRLRLVGVWDIVALNVDAKLLFQSPIFEGMTRYQIRKAILLGQLRRYEAGRTFVRQGERSRALYVVLRGEAAVDAIGRDGARTPIREVGPGDVIGEIGFADAVERTADAVAKSPVLVLELERAAMDKALRFHPRIATLLYSNILRLISARFAEQMRKSP